MTDTKIHPLNYFPHIWGSGDRVIFMKPEETTRHGLPGPLPVCCAHSGLLVPSSAWERRQCALRPLPEGRWGLLSVRGAVWIFAQTRRRPAGGVIKVTCPGLFLRCFDVEGSIEVLLFWQWLSHCSTLKFQKRKKELAFNFSPWQLL